MKRNGNRSARTSARVCGQCGLNHRRLGVVVERDTMRRWVRNDNQVLGLAGGALGMIAALFDRHPEVTHFEAEIETGTRREHLRADRAAFRRHSFRQDLGWDSQVILRLKDWREIGDVERESPRGDVVTPQVKQLDFNAMLGRAGRVWA